MALDTFQPNTKLDPIPVNSNNQNIASGLDMHYNAAWTAYTPLWTCTTTAPAIGNGTLNGRYLKLGRTVIVRIFWKAGSTSTYGSGTFEFSLPFRQAASYGTDGNQTNAGPVYIEDSGVTGYFGHARANNLNKYVQVLIGSASGTYTSITPVTATVPFTFATSDFISLLYIYETDATGDY